MLQKAAVVYHRDMELEREPRHRQ